MPLREVRKKFTKSELYILAWRSQEQSYNLKHHSAANQPESNASQLGIPKHLFDDEGRVDLRKATGREALEYFRIQGVQLPIIQRGDGVVRRQVLSIQKR